MSILNPVAEARAVLNAVADYTELSVAEILAAEPRTTDFSIARQFAAWVIRHRTGMSYPALGRFLKRDHTTIMHSCKRFAARLTVDSILRGQAEEFLRSLPMPPQHEPLGPAKIGHATEALAKLRVAV